VRKVGANDDSEAAAEEANTERGQGHQWEP